MEKNVFGSKQHGILFRGQHGIHYFMTCLHVHKIGSDMLFVVPRTREFLAFSFSQQQSGDPEALVSPKHSPDRFRQMNTF